jgi:hypothetical protein
MLISKDYNFYRPPQNLVSNSNPNLFKQDLKKKQNIELFNLSEFLLENVCNPLHLYFPVFKITKQKCYQFKYLFIFISLFNKKGKFCLPKFNQIK